MLVLVMGIIAVSIYKTIDLVKSSRFTKSYFTILLVSDMSYIMNINLSKKKLTVLTLKDKSIQSFVTSLPQASYYMGLPIDAVISFASSRPLNPEKDLLTLAGTLSFFTQPKDHTLLGVNSFDIAKLYFHSKYSISDMQIESYPAVLGAAIDQTQQVKLYNFLSDQEIINNPTTIEVVNASGIDGVGARIAEMLRVVGYNVVAIRSSFSDQKSSIIIRGGNDATLGKIQEILPIQTQFVDEEGIVDISIIIDRQFVKSYLQIIN